LIAAAGHALARAARNGVVLYAGSMLLVAVVIRPGISRCWVWRCGREPVGVPTVGVELSGTPYARRPRYPR